MFGKGKKKPVLPAPDAKVYQEFYCASSGGGCGGYIVVKLRTSFNGIVQVVCPNCKHKHQRNIKRGRIVEQGRYTLHKEPDIEIVPTMAAFSKKPRHVAACHGEERDAKVFKSETDMTKQFLREAWFDMHGAGTD